MAQFRLPRNSRVKPGKNFGGADGAKNAREFVIYRYEPDSGENPRLDRYRIDMDSCGPMVLDALIKIKNEVDPSLTFRRRAARGISGPGLAADYTDFYPLRADSYSVQYVVAVRSGWRN